MTHDPISIIIPVYNDPGGVDQTIRSLLNLNYSRYEIIAVDNNSTDETLQVIRNWSQRRPGIVHAVRETSIQSSYAARNTGIEHARGDILTFIDADMTVSAGWLSNIAAEFKNTETDYLGYEIQVYMPEGEKSLWGWYDQIMGLPVRYYFDQKQFVPTSCLVVRKTVFEKVGRFNPHLVSGGDREFGNRVSAHPELDMAFSESTVAFHPARTSFQEHYLKAVRIGRGLSQAWQQSSQTSLLQNLLSELIDHILPPDPFRIYRQCREKDPNLYEYLLLYSMNIVLRYLRVYGALRHYLT